MTAWDDYRKVIRLAEGGEHLRAAETARGMAIDAQMAVVEVIRSMREHGHTWAEIGEILEEVAPGRGSVFWPGTSAAALNRSYGHRVDKAQADRLADSAAGATAEIRALERAHEEYISEMDQLDWRRGLRFSSVGRRVLAARWRHVYDDCSQLEQRLLRGQLDDLRQDELEENYSTTRRAIAREDGAILIYEKPGPVGQFEVVEVHTHFRRFGAPDTSAYEALQATFCNWPGGAVRES